MKQIYFLVTLLFFSCASSDSQKNSTTDSNKEQKTTSESMVSFAVNASKRLEVHDVNGAVMFNIEKGSLRTRWSRYVTSIQYALKVFVRL